MTTRSRCDVIMEQIVSICEYTQKEAGFDVLPLFGCTLDKIDLPWVLEIINYAFASKYPTHDYRAALEQLLRARNIVLPSEQMDKHLPRLTQFIDFVIEFIGQR